MPRTTLQIEDDALEAATEDRSGFRVVRLSPQSPKVTAALVDQLREDLL